MWLAFQKLTKSTINQERVKLLIKIQEKKMRKQRVSENNKEEKGKKS